MPNALMLYRLARMAHTHHVPLVPSLLKGAIFLIYNSIVPFQATIGPASKLAHGGIGVVIHPDVRIGRNVLIGQGVTIGGRSKRPGVPRIGDNVYIGAGARILGDLTVGSGSIIAANAVVTSDVPARSIAAGIPARIVREDIDVSTYENLPMAVGGAL